MNLTIITPTADQPTGIALCERYMARQTLAIADVQWIVADDGVEPARLTMGQTLVRRDRDPYCKPHESLCRNLLAAVELVMGDLIVFVEHDDWYDPAYLERMMQAADENPSAFLIGDASQRYYNVAKRCWRIFQNTGASLCQTAIRRVALRQFQGTVETCLANGSCNIDAKLWKATGRERWHLTPDPRMLGIKGLPGRPGLGIGHRPQGTHWTPDATGEKLCEWIGTDAVPYFAMRAQ